MDKSEEVDRVHRQIPLEEVWNNLSVVVEERGKCLVRENAHWIVKITVFFLDRSSDSVVCLTSLKMELKATASKSQHHKIFVD